MRWTQPKTWWVDLSVDGILADARRKTQLDDFGPEDFLRRLQLLCDEWSSESGLTITLAR
ncbi:MAG: hypothetical protein IPK95_13690 [Cellvibrionales bacterium]|nr:hypothetical protein [Cellvibrionales bacterium]